MTQLKICAVAAAVGALLGSSAQAANYLRVTYAAPGVSASWDQAFAPTPLVDYSGAFTDVGVWNYTDSLGDTNSFVSFFSAADGGGWQDAAGAFGPTGAQLYTGSEAAPIFAVGTYAESVGTLTLTAVPEPSAWALMIVGFGLIGSVARRRGVAAA